MPESEIARPSAWSRWTLLSLAILISFVGAAGAFGERGRESVGFFNFSILLMLLGFATLVYAGYYSFGHPQRGGHTPLGVNPATTTVPALWTRNGLLGVGVSWRGVLHRRFTVGIQTNSTRPRAHANLPPWIDFRAAWRYSVSTWSEEELLAQGQQKIVLTEEEAQLGRNMADAWYRNLVAHRVLRLGNIPVAMIPEACRSLCESDMKLIIDACEDLDAALKSYLANAGPDAPVPNND